MQRIVFATGPIARAPMRRQPRRDFAQMLSRSLGVEVVVVVASTYNELAGLMHRGDAQVAWLPPAVYVRSNERDGVQLLLETIRRGDSRFRSVLFVRSDAPYEGIDDLKGQAVAWVDQNSCSGYLFPRISLLDRGIDPRTHFKRELVLGSHEAVIRAVEVGTAAIGATFMDQNGKGSTPGWTIEVDAEEMRPLLLSDPIPADTICVRGDLDETLRSDLREALLGLHELDGGAEVIYGLFGAERFQPGAIDDYDAIRRAIAVSCA
jgi:phosphonate transport system substrate-binding protein